MKDKLISFSVVLLWSAAPWSLPGQVAESAPLSHYLDEAIANDAEIAAARLRWESVNAEVPVASSLPDPELAYGYFFSPVETRVGAQNQKFGLFQKIPWPARLGERRRLAESGVEVAYFQYLATVRERTAAAKVAWIRMATVDARIDIVERQLALLEDALSTVDNRFATGRSALADRSLMRQQLTQLESRRLALHGEREAALSAMRRFAPERTGDRHPSLDSIETRPLPERADLARMLRENSERLQVRSAEVTAAERAHEVARLAGYPDITVGLEYTQVSRRTTADPPDDGQDAVMGSVRISIPIWRGKYNALEKSARYALSSAQERKRNTLNDLLEKMDRQYAKASALVDQVRLYEERLLPQTRETFEATLAGFGSGQADALRWIEAQRDLLDAEMGLVLLKSESLVTLTELERTAAIQLIGENVRTTAQNPQ